MTSDRDGNIREAQAFARHRDPRVTMRYDDNRKDLGGKAAEAISRTFFEEET